MESAAPLGAQMFFRAFVLRGELTVPKWRGFLVACAESMGMSPVGKPANWKYPVGDKGGNGHTIVQPITESFLAVDTWPDHDGAYLVVCSCKKFAAVQIVDTALKFGLDVDDVSKPSTLRLK